VISFLIGLLRGAGYAATSTGPLAALISGVTSNLIELIILPLQLVAWTLVYFDLRVRTEGFDLAISTLNPSENAMVDLSTIPAGAPAQKWLTGDDIGKFIVVTMVGIGVYFLFVFALAVVGISMASFLGPK